MRTSSGAPRRVVVTGVGLVTAAGVGAAPVWERLRSDPPRPASYAPEPGGALSFPAFRTPDYSLAEVGVPRPALAWLERDGLGAARDLRHLLASTALALADAGLPPDSRDADPPVAVVAANESPGFEELSRALFRLGRERPLPEAPAERYEELVDEFFQLNTFLLPHYLAKAFGLRGYSLFVNSACTSGLNAVDVAAQQIRAGRADAAVVAAADDPLSLAKFLWFRGLGMYAEDGRLLPFDAGAAGTVFGDGGAALVLEDAAAARRRGAAPWAEVAGAGFAQDGWKIAAPWPLEPRAATAVEGALEEAGLAPADVDLVVPHGVGSAVSDGYEAGVLHRLFGDDAAAWPAVTALKPLVGHNLGGSSLVELGLVLLAMRHGLVPPTPGPGEPLRRHPLPLARRWSERPIEVALKLSCGFAGYYGALVLRAVGAERAGVG